MKCTHDNIVDPNSVYLADGSLKYPELRSEQWLRMRYEVDGLSQAAIANQLGCRQNAVFVALRRYDIKARTASRIHGLSEIDEDARTAICTNCGPVRITRSGTTKSTGRPRWGCVVAERVRHRRTKRGDKKDYCENPFCTATIEHFGQLDVHHVDGNHDNNAPENRRTLCANCHRLEHAKQRDDYEETSFTPRKAA